MYALNADPPRWLTWSGAANTDEGFYTLDARHRVLFGADAPGDFHDRVLAPGLSLTQEAWYRLFGTGVTAARSLDAGCGLLCVGVLAWGLNRTHGRRAALWGAVLLGLCPTFVYYNRLALQETPAALLLTLAWALWSAPHPKGRGTAFAGGMALVLACAVKSLCVVFLPVALVLAVTRKGRGLLFTLGATLTALVLLITWIWPERHALGAAAAFYSHAQAGAGGAAHVLWNVSRALVGDAVGVRRGLAPYALLFWPALAVLAGLSLTRPGRDPFLVAWAACGVAYCVLSSYAPDRYYVLFLPALAAMAARTVSQMGVKVQRAWAAVALVPSLAWLGMGLAHPLYCRAQGSQALAKALPPGATVVGDAAPSLCIGTRLRAAPVQFGLSNYADPVTQTGATYIVTGREPVWTRFWGVHAPGACVPARRLLTVTLPSGRVVDVYRSRREPGATTERLRSDYGATMERLWSDYGANTDRCGTDYHEMTLQTLYPFWNATHELWLEQVKTLSESDMDTRTAPRSPTIRRVLLDFLRRERLLVAHLVAGWERELPSPGGTRTGVEMASALSAARETTALALAPLSAENMRSVRHVPEGVFGNEPAGNVSVAFLVWSLLEEECAARGIMQSKLREGRG